MGLCPWPVPIACPTSIMMLLRCLALAPALAFFGSCASPTSPSPQDLAERYGPGGGESEISAGGSVGFRSNKLTVGGDSGTQDEVLYAGQVGWGYYLTDAHETGAQIVLSGTTSDDSASDSETQSLLPYYRYNFRFSDRAQWYVGVHAGVSRRKDGGNSETDLSYGAHVGFKSWINPDLSFFFEPRFTVTDIDEDLVDDPEEIRLLLGFTYSL